MKIRKGFVSNSSSSSYICDICGRQEEVGYDPASIDMFECEEYHMVCEKHSLCSPRELIQIYDLNGGEKYNVNKFACPVCTLGFITAEILLKHLLVKYNITREQVQAEIQEKFKNLEELEKFYNDVDKGE